MNQIQAELEAVSGDQMPDASPTQGKENLFPSPLGVEPGKLILMANRTDNPQREKKLRKRAAELRGQADFYAALDARRCLAEDAEDPTELPAPDTADFGRQPQEKYGGIQVDLHRIGGEKIEESSGVRYCLAGHWRHVTGQDPRPKRYEVVLPPENNPVDETTRPQSESDVALMQTVAQPQTAEEARSAKGRLAEWQRSQAKTRLREEIVNSGRLAVHAEAEQPHGILKSFTVTALDAEFVHSFAHDLSELHYLKGFTSGGGYLPNSDKPDYRRYDYMALDAVEASVVAQALGVGPYVRPVDDEEKADLERNGQMYKVIVDGRGMLLHPSSPSTHEEREFQLRAAIGHDGRPKGYAKGMARVYDGDVMAEALAWARDNGAETAVTILEHVLETGEPTLILVKDDQIKVGHERIRPYGEALVAATHLRGTDQTETVETESGSYERAKPQYGRIRSNPQVTQLLTPDGFELLEEHLRTETRIVADKLRTVPGIAELVSQSVRQQLEEAKQGTYHQGRDQLTDAIIGGGVRMKQSDWEDALTGGQGQIQMLPSTLGRLDFNISAYVRSHLLTAMGIYGYGHHHAACENSSALCRSLWQSSPPQTDASAVAFPYKVSRLMNADDDGDIVVSLAADAEVLIADEDGTPTGETQVQKVVLTWRYPCVDVPVLWAFPKGTPTPFDGADDEERARFKRIIEVFGPKHEEGEPGFEEDEVTLLSTHNAVRLSDQGAKEQVDKTRASGPVNTKTSMELVDKKRQLGQAGPLTRDLERCADLLALAMRKGNKALEKGWNALYEESGEIYNDAMDLATTTSVRIEDNLTAFKYETMPTLEGVRFDIEKLAREPMGKGEVYLGSDEAVRQNVPLDYHDVVDAVDSVLPRYAREGISLIGGLDPDDSEDYEPWEGPNGPSRHAGLIRRICQEEIPKVADSLASIETTKVPFRKVLAQRARDYFDEHPDEKERLVAESRYVLQLCRHYRQFWRTVNDKETEARTRVAETEEFEKRIQEWRSRAARGIHESMKALARDVSPEGLAYGIARDWNPDRGHSASAGMAMLTGRIGEVLLPAGTEVESVRSDEQYRTVFTRGDDIPGAFQTDTVTVVDLIRLDSSENEPDARILLESDEAFNIHVKSDEPGHPVPADVATGEYTMELTKTSRRGGLLRWRRG
jgi:hypothetical protein